MTYETLECKRLNKKGAFNGGWIPFNAAAPRNYTFRRKGAYKRRQDMGKKGMEEFATVTGLSSMKR